MSQTASQPVNPYLKTKVLTASPQELRLMLLDGAIKFAELGRDGLVAKDYEKSFTNISRAEDIVMELLESLKPEVDPDLCEKLKNLYVYLYLELVRASSEKDVARIEEVIRLLRYERETWQLAMAQLESDRRGGMHDDDSGDGGEQSPPSISVSG